VPRVVLEVHLRSIALAEDITLYLTDRDERGEEPAQFLRDKFDIEVQFRRCDLSSMDSRMEFYAALKKEGRRFWGLINVAGLDYEGEFLERTH
jgi:short-subunit dehydrogenase